MTKLSPPSLSLLPTRTFTFTLAFPCKPEERAAGLLSPRPRPRPRVASSQARPANKFGGRVAEPDLASLVVRPTLTQDQQAQVRRGYAAGILPPPTSISAGIELKVYQMMDLSTASVVTAKAYKYKAESLVKDYLLADSYVSYTAVLGGILMCKMVYDITHLISSLYYKGYGSLTKIQKLEWNNRGMSTVHAIFITLMSVYLVFFSNLFSDELDGPVTVQSSNLSNFALGVSLGYFIADLAMISWAYPSLGGMEYVLHHLLSIISLVYAIYSEEGQLYTYMVLISETTTPGINLRWFLDTVGMKRSKAYLVNGVTMFVAWLVARIILFIYLFYHIYFHYDQVKQMRTFSCILVFAVPTILLAMNTVWFAKILRGLKKTLAKRQ